MDYQIELVVARFEEDLRWIRRVPSSVRITIYNKGGSPALPSDFPKREGVTVAALVNEGREAETYLRHLVGRYDSLAPLTVFCQGHPFDHAPDFHASLQELASCEGRIAGANALTPFTWYGFLDETDDPNGRRLFVPWSKNPERRELSTGVLYEALFGEASPNCFHFRGGAQFAVSRDAVYRRSLDFYERAHELSASIPLAAHSYERIWDRLFGDPLIDPSTLGPEGVLYRKRIRRLEQGEDGRGEIGERGMLDSMDSV
jgi:hypothetical protein